MKITRIRATDYIIKFLRQLRLDNNINGTDLSEQIGKAKSYISVLENKNIAFIKVRDFENLILALLPQLASTTLSSEKLMQIEKIINNNAGDPKKVLKELNTLQQVKINTKSFKHELGKQIHEKNLSILDLENNCNIKNGTLMKIAEHKILDEDFVYTTLKNVFSSLGYVTDKEMDTFLSMIGVTVPDGSDVANLSDINYCYKIDNDLPDFPYNTKSTAKTWGEYLEYREYEYNNVPTEEDIKARDEYEIEKYEKENLRRALYPKTRKKELIDKINQSSELLKNLVNTIDVENYGKTNSCERYIETITNLLLTTDGLKIFKLLFSYPLQKIPPKSLREIIDFIDSKLEFEYTFQEEVPDPDGCYIEDCCIGYIHLECIYKENIWGDISQRK